MIAATASHIFRLITFRHNGSGLNTRSPAILFAVVAATAALSFARWGMPLQAAAHAAICAIMCLYSVRVGVGYALLSIGIDATAMAAWFIPKDIFTGWEVAALGWLAFRVGKNA